MDIIVSQLWKLQIISCRAPDLNWDSGF